MESGDSSVIATQGAYPKYARILVVVSVFLTCLGYLYRYSDDNLRAFSQIYFEWEFSELAAERVVTIMKATLLLALVCAPFRKLRYLVVPALCALSFELLCIVLNPSALHPYLSVPAQALRLSPFILILMPWKRKAVVWILKLGIAATFIAHGIEALLTYAEFVDYILAFFQLLHFPIKEATAATFLHVIGTIDILLGHHAMVYGPRQTKWVLGYMMVWGAVTAFVRIMYYGPGAWHEVAIRNAHFLMVLLLILIYREATVDPEPSPPAETT